MKNKELVHLIRQAYPVEASDRRAAFLRQYPRRELRYGQLLLLQLRYMGAPLAAVGGCALALLLCAAAKLGDEMLRLTAVLVPVAALCAMTGFGRSERCRMSELEMTARFSLRLLRMLRLAVIGFAGLLVMLTASCALHLLCGAALLPAVVLAAVPYLLTTLLCMLLLRRWHSAKNIYGCIMIAGAVSALMLGGMEHIVACSRLLCAALPVLLLLTGVEARKLINESEELQWSLC